jgi:hypothetical protein
VEVHGLRVLKHDGTSDEFPVLDGDVGQAELRAALSQRPGDLVVAVTDHAYIRLLPRPAAPGTREDLVRTASAEH